MAGGAKKRGPHPQDRGLFAEKNFPALREAVADLSWLRTRGYAENSSIKIVGDRYGLTARQRTAVARCACGDIELDARTANRLPMSDVRDLELLIDGFNLLTTIEAALGGGILLRGRDSCIRDLTSMHGNYRVLGDTRAALDLIFQAITRLEPVKVVWYLDKPVSNSGRLKSVIDEVVASDHPLLKNQVRLVKDPDPILKKATPKSGVVTADSAILDAGIGWVNLVDYVLAVFLPEREVLDFSEKPAEEPESEMEEAKSPAIRRISGETTW